MLIALVPSDILEFINPPQLGRIWACRAKLLEQHRKLADLLAYAHEINQTDEYRLFLVHDEDALEAVEDWPLGREQVERVIKQDVALRISVPICDG